MLKIANFRSRKRSRAMRKIPKMHCQVVTHAKDIYRSHKNLPPKTWKDAGVSLQIHARVAPFWGGHWAQVVWLLKKSSLWRKKIPKHVFLLCDVPLKKSSWCTASMRFANGSNNKTLHSLILNPQKKFSRVSGRLFRRTMKH